MVQKVLLEINRVTLLNSIFEYNCSVSRKQNPFVNCKRRQQYMQASNEKEHNCTCQLKQRIAEMSLEYELKQEQRSADWCSRRHRKLH